jgi:TRAP-type C4-dicarboxylate transport system permease small subunit
MGVEEMSTLFGLWLYYAGFALVSTHNQHIRGGLIAGRIGGNVQNVVERAFLLICAAICLYFLVLSLEYAQFVVSVNRRSTFLRWPTILWVASLNVGLLLSTVTLAIQAISPIKRAAP